MESKQDARRPSDREMLQDALDAQKQIGDSYNAFAGDCTAPPIRDLFLTLLNEEHQIRFDLFNEMSKRGWCSTHPADPQQIQRVKQKFQGSQQ